MLTRIERITGIDVIGQDPGLAFCGLPHFAKHMEGSLKGFQLKLNCFYAPV